MGTFPLYKGLTRVPTYWGVPVGALVGLVGTVALLGMLLSLWWWGLLFPGWFILAQLTRADDRAFRIVSLWARTRLLNRLRLLVRAGRGEFWGASSYAVSVHRQRAWEAEDVRWHG